jgi:hypothetical protein
MKGEAHHRFVLIEPTTQTTHFMAHNSISTQTLEVFRPPIAPSTSDVPVGRAKFIQYSSHVDIQVGNTGGFIEHKGTFSRSTLVRGGPFAWEWQTVAMSRDLNLLDERGLMIAKYEVDMFEAEGRLVIGMPTTAEAVQWVVVSGLAKVEQMRKIRRRSNREHLHGHGHGHGAHGHHW